MNDYKEAKIISEKRAIIKSTFGIVLTCIQIFIFAVCIGVSVVNFVELNGFSLRRLSEAEGTLCWILGMVPKVVVGSGSQEYRVAAFLLYLMVCLLQIYIPLRALVQPSFLVGKPPTNSFWPLALALILRAISGIVHFNIIGSSIILHAVLVVLINVAYSFAVYEIYSVDDDDLPMIGIGNIKATNLKPWQYEIKNDLPRYSDAKKFWVK